MSKQRNYEDKVYFLGRLTAFIFVLATLLLPLMLYINWGLLPTKPAFVAGITIIASILIPVLLGEFLSFAPVVGSAGYFVMLLSGNFMNIKVPAALVALDSVGLDANSEEGDTISTLAIAASTIVTELIIIVGVIMLTPFSSFFTQPAIKEGFGQIVPALFGALFISSLIKNWKSVVVPTIVGFIIIKFQLVNALYYIPAIIFSSALITTILFKMKVYGKKPESQIET